ncbi:MULTISPECIES: hypothetical protein [Micromonosporaceae]|uniref:hypothetical protein n=1 Tax=Micromonosporaceae TaxID=28056 RepID=UPI00248CF992|nr:MULTISPECIES: hypothetical protein [unclassified Solwaraspora]WBB96505.1 hypothetical protein O7553_24870 [Solwaraspora sp. WMMA2059]WBC19590.1 hypothetical protein O7543_22495 [Solwaraspora sp. WMMA2080]
MSVNDVKVRIGLAIEAAEEAKKLIEQLAEVAAEAGDLALRTVHDSQHDCVNEGREHFKAAIREVELTIRRIDACVEHARVYRRELG